VQQLMSGATADLYTVATHPTNPHLFANAADNSILRVWDAQVRFELFRIVLNCFELIRIPTHAVGHALQSRSMDRCMSVGFPCRSVAFSQVRFCRDRRLRIQGDKGRGG
jgi:hypothetical protein